MVTPIASRPLRVACFAHLAEVSGATVSVLDIARGLDPARFRCQLVMPGRPGDPPDASPLARRAAAAGVSYVMVANPVAPLSAGVAVARLRAVKAMMALLRDGAFDLAYVSSTASVLPGLAAWRAGVPVVWHVHETLPEHPGALTRAKMALIRRLSRGLVDCSMSARASFPAPAAMPRLLQRNWVDVAALSGAKEEPGAATRAAVEANLGLVPADRLILANGVIPRKGPDTLLDAFAALPAEAAGGGAAKLAITGGVGPGDEAWLAALADRVSRPPRAGRATLTGPRDDLPALMARADVFVSAGRNEGLPIALIEAMAAGVPVVATDVGDCALLLDGGHLGTLVPPDDAPALGRALAEILADPAAARHRAAAARARVSTDYAPAGFWKELEDFLAG